MKDDEDYTLARGLQGNLQSETRTESLLLAHGIITTWISHPLYAAHCRFNRRGGASSFSLTSFRGRRPCSIAVSYIESIQTESANSSLSEFNFGEQRPENKKGTARSSGCRETGPVQVQVMGVNLLEGLKRLLSSFIDGRSFLIGLQVREKGWRWPCLWQTAFPLLCPLPTHT